MASRNGLCNASSLRERSFSEDSFSESISYTVGICFHIKNQLDQFSCLAENTTNSAKFMCPNIGFILHWFASNAICHNSFLVSNRRVSSLAFDCVNIRTVVIAYTCRYTHTHTHNGTSASQHWRGRAIHHSPGSCARSNIHCVAERKLATLARCNLDIRGPSPTNFGKNVTEKGNSRKMLLNFPS